jgi:hypothetical protein
MLMATKKKTFWISYDLGLKGDYPGMYKFLDALKAKECGDSLAFFSKELASNDDYAQVIKDELTKNVGLSTTDRVYLIYLNDEGLIKGKFLNGGRKRAPWEGYAIGESQTDEGS